MALYDRILVPTDGSSEGERAVKHALDLAAVHDARVHALYVINVSSYAGLPMESSWDGIDELLRSDAQAAVEEVEAIADGHDIDIDTSVAEGSPSREIIKFAEEGSYDIIVMGTHGRGGIDRLLLGSVAEKVVRGSSVPVLTVRVGDAATGADVGADSTASEGVSGSEASGSS